MCICEESRVKHTEPHAWNCPDHGWVGEPVDWWWEDRGELRYRGYSFRPQQSMVVDASGQPWNPAVDRTKAEYERGLAEYEERISTQLQVLASVEGETE